jgi:HSP20 family protein
MLVRYSKPFGIDLFDAIFNDEIFNTTSVDYDITEDDEKFGLEFMLPGFKKEDMSLSVDDGVLTVEGERKVQEETKFNRKGSFYGKFKKSFTLPDDVLSEKINASFTDGILSLEIPKDVEKKLSKVIEIN